jgi:hypothetical protein
LEAAGFLSKQSDGSGLLAIPGYPHLLLKQDSNRAALREAANNYMVGCREKLFAHADCTSMSWPRIRSCLLQTGTGTDPDQQLATELFRLAAAAGDPGAQGHMAMRLVFGLHAPGSAQGNSIKHFGEVRNSTALTLSCSMLFCLVLPLAVTSAIASGSNEVIKL